MGKIAAVICAFNEEKTIRNVMFSIAESNVFDEIIIVNDGSTDETENIIQGCTNCIHNLIHIYLPENKGKGYAMAIGVENSSSEIIVFCDADLSNLKKEHFEKLTIPIVENEVDMVLGQAKETLINYKINPFKSFTGERALLKEDIISILEDMKSSKFGVETLINLYYQAHEKKVKYIMLAGLKHPTKFEKINQLHAIKEFAFEGHQIVLTVFNNFKLVTKIIKNIV